MEVQRCKGTRDLTPGQMTAFRFIEGVFRDVCLQWGYGEVRTPTIEYLHLFTSAGTLTPETLGRVYSFLDWDGWSGERVVLRPDGTIPVARMYIESGNTGLARLFYLANIFVFEASGRESRERWQCGAELIGPGSRQADAELISLSLEVLKKLDIADVELRLSHAGFIKALLAGLGISPEEQARAFDQIMDGKAENLAGLVSAGSGAGQGLLPLLGLQGQSSGYLKNLKALLGDRLPEVIRHLDDFTNLVAILDDLGYRYRIDIPSGGGFEYYTGAMFQLYASGEKVGGGGRYDALIPSMGGGNTGASGFALYLDRLMSLVKPDGGKHPERIIVRNRLSSLKPAFEAAQALRQAGYIAEMELDGQSAAWTLDVQENDLFFLQGKSGRCESGSLAGIIKYLGSQGAD